ncbi:MAG: amidohydrolase family protein [Kosmotoga sp.]|uniref:amidohydrolase family protein n=1 Tax=Kosmotoga sp. TaxID=1955248 RepID=UPI001DC055B3|nr:amidohydrolase family protein [Kosmotoga sp.]MBO8167128.1 amidohydrolase family protein [Kosmotoga sp.]MCD6159813.1 amidohydrolase family protein [Kosmotoga sp.]
MIIKNVSIFTNDPENYFIPRGFVEIRGRVIRNVGRMNEYTATDDEELDAPDAIIVPGLVNAHISLYNFIHNLVYQNNANNIVGSNYFVNLINFFKKFDQKGLSKYSIEMGALLAQLNGITTIFGPIFDSEALNPDIIREIAEKYHIRLVTGPVVFKENIDAIVSKWIDASKTDYYYPVVYITELAEYSEEELKKLTSFIASGIDVILVVFDMHSDDTRCLSLYGEHLIDRLLKSGLMIPHSGIAYAGNMRETDMDVIASKQMFVIKSLRTELFAGTFKSNIADFLGRGMNVCIGSGLLDADLLGEGRGLILSERHFRGFDIKVIDYELKKTLFENNYKLAEKFFKRGFGKIKAGYEADFMLAKPRNPFSTIRKELKSLSEFISDLSKNYYVCDVWTSGERIIKSCNHTRMTPEDVNEIRERLNSLE